MATLKGWVKTNPFTCTVVDGPHIREDDDERMTYQVRCQYEDEDGAEEITVPWTVHVTSTHWVEDTPWDLLDCLVSDTYSMINGRVGQEWVSFEEWADEFGYDTDSRRAEKLYQECRSIAALVRELLGDDLVVRLATKYERL